MKLGLVLPHGEPGISPDIIRELAQSAEALGYHSLWAIEHDVFPATRYTAASADRSSRDAVGDPLAALAFAAAGTERIRIGLSVVNVPFHSPVALATSLSALDRLSNGRVQVGIGAGYTEPECQAVTSTFERKSPASEFVEAFASLWRGSTAGYRGAYFFIPKGAAIPEPVQTPSPPVSLVAFAPPAVLSPTVLANGGAHIEPAKLRQSQMAGLVSGICASVATCSFGASMAVRARIVVTAEALGPGRAMFHGSPSQIQADIALAQAHGVSELMFDPGAIDGDADLSWTLSTMRMVREMAGVAPLALVASA